MKKTYFFKRIQKKDLHQVDVNEIGSSINTFNLAKRFAFQTLVRQERWESKSKVSLHVRVKNKYGINDYYTNSGAVREYNT